MNFKKIIKNLDANSLYDFDTAKFDGFYINNARPYHFFYDQIKSLVFLREESALEKTPVFYNNSFFALNEIAKNTSIYSNSNSKSVFIRPSTIGQNYCNALASKEAKKQMIAMESLITRFSLNQKTANNASLTTYDLILWIGVTGQKRSWVEQSIGYAKIILKLTESFSSILVYIDGLTARHNEQINVPEDQEVAESIIKLAGDKAKIVSLIGKDYCTKIQCCNEIDVFIANAGTGCMVPLRFCKKPGVLHSNHTIDTFPDNYEQFIGKVSKEFVTEINPDKSTPGMLISYKIDWRVIYDLLVDAIYHVKKIELVKIGKYEKKTRKHVVDELSAFRQANNRLIKKEVIKPGGIVEVLKEIAIGFENSGDIETAKKIMLQALRLRPNGKFLKKKIEQYNSQLDD